MTKHEQLTFSKMKKLILKAIDGMMASAALFAWSSVYWASYS